MQQSELNRAVARVTGETIATIRQLGFSLAEPDESDDVADECHGPFFLDWEQPEPARFSDYLGRAFDEPLAA